MKDDFHNRKVNLQRKIYGIQETNSEASPFVMIGVESQGQRCKT